MERRNFLTAVSAFSIASAFQLKSEQVQSSNDRIFPQVLKPGDTIGVVAPGTSVSDPDDLQRAREALDYFGLKVKFGKNIAKGSGYKSRSIKERVDDIHDMFTDKTVKGVFCIRGGYGSAQLLDSLDFGLIKENPKVFVGYSDITALHLAINKLSGLVTFHGPVLLSGFSSYSENYFRKALFSTSPVGEIANPNSKNNFRAVHPVRTVNPGKASGKIIGGNLSLISSLMGTRYEIDTKDKILFIEDVGEEPYRIDRMLTQLKLAKKLLNAKGVVFGECKDCNYDGLQSSRAWDFSLGEIIDSIFSDIKIPVFTGLTIGHTSDQATMPLGLEAEIDADKCIINILESGVRE